jgi:hypothetical protein
MGLFSSCWRPQPMPPSDPAHVRRLCVADSAAALRVEPTLCRNPLEETVAVSCSTQLNHTDQSVTLPAQLETSSSSKVCIRESALLLWYPVKQPEHLKSKGQNPHGGQFSLAIDDAAVRHVSRELMSFLSLRCRQVLASYGGWMLPCYLMA